MAKMICSSRAAMFNQLFDGLHTARHILTEFINPKPANFPAEALELEIAPMVVILAPATGSPVDRFAIHFNVNLYGPQYCQVQVATGCRGVGG